MAKIGCGTIAEHIWESALGEDSQAYEEIAAHIAVCPPCRAAVAHWQLLDTTLKMLSPTSPAVENAFVESVLAAKSTTSGRPSNQKQRRLWQWTGVLTTTVAASVLFLLFGRQPTPLQPPLSTPLRVSSISVVVDDAPPVPGHIIPHHITHVRDDIGADATSSTAAIRVAHGRSIQ